MILAGQKRPMVLHSGEISLNMTDDEVLKTYEKLINLNRRI